MRDRGKSYVVNTIEPDATRERTDDTDTRPHDDQEHDVIREARPAGHAGNMNLTLPHVTVTGVGPQVTHPQ